MNGREVHDKKVRGRAVVTLPEFGHLRREKPHLDLTPHLNGGMNKIRVSAIFVGADQPGGEAWPQHFGLAIYTVGRRTPDDLRRRCLSVMALKASLQDKITRNPSVLEDVEGGDVSMEDVQGGDVTMEDAAEDEPDRDGRGRLRRLCLGREREGMFSRPDREGTGAMFFCRERTRERAGEEDRRGGRC